jgi:hypothetical protein
LPIEFLNEKILLLFLSVLCGESPDNLRWSASCEEIGGTSCGYKSRVSSIPEACDSGSETCAAELPESIEQEIQAKIMLHNIVQAVCHKAQQNLPPDKQACWQVNRAYALKQIARVIIASFKGSLRALQASIEALTHVLTKTLERIRPNRSFQRKHSVAGAQRPRKSYR